MKQFIDKYLAILGIIWLSPILILLYFVILLTMGSPVIFKQERSGKNGKPFSIFKFRSMTDKKDDNGQLLPNDQRITKIGKVLRKTSLDELPQLFNVVKGDLSLVGPRPLHMEYNQYYNEEQAKRLDVTPGITGWAQINGRNNLTWKEKFELDTWYIDNKSLKLDIYILFQTVLKVLKRNDVDNSETGQVEKFNGRN